MLMIGWKRCPYCGDYEVYRSRSKPTRFTRICAVFLLQLVLCYECEERHYRPVFFPVPEYPRRKDDCQPCGRQLRKGDRDTGRTPSAGPLHRVAVQRPKEGCHHHFACSSHFQGSSGQQEPPENPPRISAKLVPQNEIMD